MTDHVRDRLVWSGNATEDGAARRGWLIGPFIPPTLGPRHTAGPEVKWSEHPAGDTRPAWTEGDTRPTVCMLVAGRFTVDLEGGRTVELVQPGDYVTWVGIDHSWRTGPDGATVATFRWPG